MVLVCVTDQESCSRLIVAGKKMADIKGTSLKTICVRPKQAIDWLASDEVEYLYSLSRQLSAEMIVLFNDSPANAVADFIRHNAVDALVVGTPPQPGQSVFISEMEYHFPHMLMMSADQSGDPQRLPKLDNCDDERLAGRSCSNHYSVYSQLNNV